MLFFMYEAPIQLLSRIPAQSQDSLPHQTVHRLRYILLSPAGKDARAAVMAILVSEKLGQGAWAIGERSALHTPHLWI